MAKRFTVFIPEPEWAESHEVLEETAHVRVGTPGTAYTEDLLIAEVADVDGLVISSQHHVSRRVLEAASRLKVVAKYGSKPGLDNVDLGAATERRVVVCYTPGANADSVAEHTIALILALLKRLYVSSYRLRQGHWRDLTTLGRELGGKTVGIVGLGTVGHAVAHKLAGFDVQLLACDPYVHEHEAQQVRARLVDLATLIRRSDIISVHAILNEETKHLIGTEEFRLCKTEAILVNTARGAIIDETALIQALKDGRIAGAALDVFTTEPPDPDDPLLNMDNVLITPHFASCTVEAFRREADMAVGEVHSVLSGQKPRFVANPKVLSRLNLK
jgi:D-3-phosphoglycerate dehydrogenase